MRPEVNSNRFEISNRFEKSFHLYWQFHCEQPWKLKSLSTFLPFTWRFQCGNFPNHSKTQLHIRRWYLLINANLIDVKQMLRYWLVFKQQQQSRCALACNFNDSAHYLLFTWKTHCGLKFHFHQIDRSEICTEVSFTSTEVTWTLIISYFTPKWNFTSKWNFKPVWLHFGSHVNVVQRNLSNFAKKVAFREIDRNKVKNFVNYKRSYR